MADARLVLVGVPLGVFETGPGGQRSALLRQGPVFVDFPPEADELLRWLTIARSREQVLDWLREHGEEPAEEQLQELEDADVLWDCGRDRTRDLAAMETLRLMPQGLARGPVAGEQDLYLITCGDNRNATVSGFLYWAWVYSDGRSLAAVAERVAEHYGVAPDLARDRIATSLNALLVAGAAYVDLVG